MASVTRLTRRGLVGWGSGSYAYYPSFNREFNVVNVDMVNNGVAIGQYQAENPEPGGRYAVMKFSTEWRAATTGTAIPEVSLLNACGFETSVLVYALSDLHNAGDGDGVTIPIDLAMWTDGLLHIVEDAVGTCVINFEAGKIPWIDWTFTGTYGPVEAIVAPTMTTANLSTPVPFQNAGLAIHDGTTSRTGLVVPKITLDVGNAIDMRPGCNGAYGYEDAIITSREPKYTIQAEARELGTTATTMNWETLFGNQNTLVTTFTHNPSATADQELDVSFSANIVEYPSLEDQNGKLMYNIAMQQTPTTGLLSLSVTET